MGNWGDKLAEAARLKKIEIVEAYLGAIFALGTAIVERSPVGNPELWAINAMAGRYNNDVAEENALLRLDPTNLTKAGRLKKGLKINDSMKIYKPEGYVGGRFRGNWQFGIDAIDKTTTEETDAQGTTSLARMQDAIGKFDSKKNDRIYITNSLPYAKPLEDGHSTQAPMGIVGLSSQEFGDYLTKEVDRLKAG